MTAATLHAVLNDCLSTLGVFLTLATKQAESGAPGISEYVLHFWSFLVLKYNGKSKNMFILNHDH